MRMNRIESEEQDIKDLVEIIMNLENPGATFGTIDGDRSVDSLSRMYSALLYRGLRRKTNEKYLNEQHKEN